MNLRKMVSGVVLVVVAALVGGCVPDPVGGLTVGVDCSTPPRLAAGASLFGCDLAGLDLSGLDLSGSNLAGANLSHVDLSGANLRDANLEGANLTGANLTGADLTGAILAGAILDGTLFISAILTGVNFDFGRVFGANGYGGGAAVGGGGVCTGPYCPGYNEATVDTGDPLCSPDADQWTTGDFYVHRSHDQLVAAGQRSVVTDASTSFRGAVIDYATISAGENQLRGLSIAHADFTDALIYNTGIACQIADGARFHGATLTGDSESGESMYLYHVSLMDSDFGASTILHAAISDVTFAGSDASGALWSSFDLEVAELLPAAMNAGLPLVLLDLSDVDLHDSILGWGGNVAGQPLGMALGGTLVGDVQPSPIRTTDWHGADLRGAQIRDLVNPNGDFTGVDATGVVMAGVGNLDGAKFDAGWLGSDWSSSAQSYSFVGAECPDGSVGSVANPCFQVGP